MIREVRVEDRRDAAYTLGSVLGQLPDRTQAWQDLHRLTRDQDSSVRSSAADALGSAFALLPDKNQGWQDLHRLTRDQDSYVRWRAADALGSAFALLPDKNQGWQDLHRLTRDQESSVRSSAADALGSAFALLPDKNQGWQDLHRLTQDQESDGRRSAARALGSAFALLPDKAQGWQDLHRLTEDQDRDVRMYAYHSQGRVSVYRATEASEKDAIKSELEAAVEFFEKSYQERSFSNPACFCRPFYRSYLALTFQGASEEEVQRYLAEAKEAVGGSENKKDLFGAVENLAKALEETQKLKEKSREQIQGDLKAYRWYCDRAAEHMSTAEDKSPVAVKLLKKCNPFLEERIQATIAEIQEKSKQICQITRGSGTEYEVSGIEIHKAAGDLLSGDLASIQTSCAIIEMQLKKFCKHLPEDEKGPVCEVIEEIKHAPEYPEKLQKIALALSCLSPILQEQQSRLSDENKPPVEDELIFKIPLIIADYQMTPYVASPKNLFS